VRVSLQPAARSFAPRAAAGACRALRAPLRRAARPPLRLRRSRAGQALLASARVAMGQCVTKPLADGDPAFDVPGPRSGARSGARGGAAARALARSNTTTSDRTAGSTPRFAPRRPSLPRKSSGNATLSAAVSRRLSGGSACSEYGDEEEEAAERVAAMRHLSTLLPRRGSDAAVAAAAAARRKAMPPTAPSKLAAALAAAVTAGDANWATGSEVVAEVLADDVQYIDLRGEVANGKQAALESMDAGAQDCVIWLRCCDSSA
jgi:hypothetical protein